MSSSLNSTGVTFSDGSSQSSAFNSSTSAVQWGNVSGRPTALSQFTNNLGNYGTFYNTIGIGGVPYDANCSGSQNCNFGIGASGATIGIIYTNCNCACACG
jgi:hypothetical protein